MEMDIISVDVDKLIPYEKNPRKNEKAVDKVAKSLKEFGFRQPIVVNEEYVIIAGHTRLKAAKKLGYTKVPVHIMSGVTEAQIKAYRLADNRTSEDAKWDPTLLTLEVFELSNELDDLSITGFNDDELMKILGQTDENEHEGEVQFSEELMEANNYIVLFFDNDVDWLNAQTHFNLQTKMSKRMNGKEWTRGIGRVVNGSEYLNQFTDDLDFLK